MKFILNKIYPLTNHILPLPQAPKSSGEDVAVISSTCFKLNSLQLRALLEAYAPALDEPPIPQDLVDNVVAVRGGRCCG